MLFQDIIGTPGMLDHTQIKPQDQTVAFMDILLHAKSKLSTSNGFGDIKIVQSDWFRAFSITTKELGFSQPYGFHRFPKETVVYHLKPKNHTDRQNVFSKSVLLIYFRAI